LIVLGKKVRRLRSSSEIHDLRRSSKVGAIGNAGPEGAIRIGDGEWLKWKYDGTTKCVILYLDRRLSYSEIRERIRKGFGDSA